MIEKQILENQIVIMKALFTQLPFASTVGELLQKNIRDTKKLLK